VQVGGVTLLKFSGDGWYRRWFRSGGGGGGNRFPRLLRGGLPTDLVGSGLIGVTIIGEGGGGGVVFGGDCFSTSEGIVFFFLVRWTHIQTKTPAMIASPAPALPNTIARLWLPSTESEDEAGVPLLLP
jgi:hypothetical protein